MRFPSQALTKGHKDQPEGCGRTDAMLATPTHFEPDRATQTHAVPVAGPVPRNAGKYRDDGQELAKSAVLVGLIALVVIGTVPLLEWASM